MPYLLLRYTEHFSNITLTVSHATNYHHETSIIFIILQMVKMRDSLASGHSESVVEAGYHLSFLSSFLQTAKFYTPTMLRIGILTCYSASNLKESSRKQEKQLQKNPCGLHNLGSALVGNKDMKEFVPMKLTTKPLSFAVPALAFTACLTSITKSINSTVPPR